MKFLDLFAGIGGFRLGLEAAGHECVGFCEIDKFARASYKAIHDTKGEIELHDIRSVTTRTIQQLGRVDILCGGFPCQSFSIAGNRNGFRDERGDLFFEAARFAKLLKPKYLFFENVSGLLTHDRGITFEIILRTLDELGYNVEWQSLNSKDFGVPQHRQRVFIIGHLREKCTRPIFPLGKNSSETNDLQRVTTNTLTTRYPGGQGNGSYVIESKPKKIGNIHPSGKGMNGEVYSDKGFAPTITTTKGEGRKIVVSNVSNAEKEPKMIQKSHGFNKGGEHVIAPTITSHSYQENNYVQVYDFYNKSIKNKVGTLTASGFNGNTTSGTFGISQGFRIRKLTPKECWRLQGFPDWAFERAQTVNSNSQLYKQAGNSVTVNVIKSIAKNFE